MSWCPKKDTAAGRASPGRSFVPGGGEEHPKFLLQWGIEIWGRLWGGTRALVHIGVLCANPVPQWGKLGTGSPISTCPRAGTHTRGCFPYLGA